MSEAHTILGSWPVPHGQMGRRFPLLLGSWMCLCSAKLYNVSDNLSNEDLEGHMWSLISVSYLIRDGRARVQSLDIFVIFVSCGCIIIQILKDKET